MKTQITQRVTALKLIQSVYDEEQATIRKEDGEWWGDYCEDNYDATGYFPTFEEDRRFGNIRYSLDSFLTGT
jgi:hypothetical protein